MGRSNGRGRRSTGRVASRPEEPAASGVGRPSGPSLAAATLPRVWQGIAYRPLDDPAAARPLFDFAAVPWPPVEPDLGWAASVPGGGMNGLCGAIVAERSGHSAMLHGPVVIAEESPLEIAAQLVAAMLDHAVAAGAHTLFARPQAVDRVWIRFGFIPVPEGALPAGLAGRAGAGLYAWRGGSAVWSLRDVNAG